MAVIKRDQWLFKGSVPSWLIIDAVRYAIGRTSYQVSTTARWILQNWDKFPEHAQTIVKQDLEGEFERDDRVRNDKKDHAWYPLGHRCDRQSWEAVRALWKSTK